MYLHFTFKNVGEQVENPLEASKSQPIKGGPSFSLSHRILRVVWNISWILCASWTPPQFSKWRNLVARSFGAQIHSSARIYGSAKIWFPANLKMGPNSTLGPGVICYCMDKVEIGAQVIVSQRVNICCGSHDIESKAFQLVTAPIFIGDNAWIAAEAFLGPGVKVGQGAVLGARGVTFKDLEPWSVYVGNPARKIRDRTRREM